MFKHFFKIFPLYMLMLWNTEPGGGDLGSTSTGEGDNSGGQGNNSGGQTGDSNNTPTGGGQQPGTNAPMFTQADLDRVAGKTRKEALATWAKEHGLGDVKDLEEIIRAKREAEEQAKSDLQKANDRAAKAEAKAGDLESQLKAERIKAAVVAKATELNFAFPADTIALLDLSAVEVDDSGKVTGFEKALDDLVKSGRLPMKGQQQQPIGNLTRRGNTGATTPNNQQGGQQQQQPSIVRF